MKFLGTLNKKKGTLLPNDFLKVFIYFTLLQNQNTSKQWKVEILF